MSQPLLEYRWGITETPARSVTSRGFGDGDAHGPCFCGACGYRLKDEGNARYRCLACGWRLVRGVRTREWGGVKWLLAALWALAAWWLFYAWFHLGGG